MEYHLRKSSNYNPKLYSYLFELRNLKCQEHDPPLQHPADILIQKYNECLSHIEKIIKISKNEDNEELRNLTKLLVFSIDSFYDNCYSIIKATKNPSAIKENFAHAWLQESKYNEGKKFFNKTRFHHDLIRKMSNYLKHDSPIITIINLKYDISPSSIKGFYIGSLIKDNKIGPNPDLHPHFRNQRTGFSYNHFIQACVGRIFLYIDALEKVFNIKNVSNVNNISLFKDLIVKIQGCNGLYFLNEYHNLPTSKVIENSENYTIRFPATLSGREPKIKNLEVSAELPFNLRTSSSNGYLPYFGTKIE